MVISSAYIALKFHNTHVIALCQSIAIQIISLHLHTLSKLLNYSVLKYNVNIGVNIWYISRKTRKCNTF